MVVVDLEEEIIIIIIIAIAISVIKDNLAKQ